MTLVFGKIDAYAASIEVMRVQIPLRALGCGNIKVLAEREALLPAGILVCHNPAVQGLRSDPTIAAALKAAMQ